MIAHWPAGQPEDPEVAALRRVRAQFPSWEVGRTDAGGMVWSARRGRVVVAASTVRELELKMAGLAP